MAIQVRKATPADTDRLCELTRAAIEELGGEPYDDNQLAAWKRGVEPSLFPIKDETAHVLVAERSQQIVGVAWTTPTAADYFAAAVDGELTGIYVDPTAAGEGIGSRLLTEVEQRARDAGVDSLGCWASLNAVGFYKKHGYETVTDQALEYDDGTTLPVTELKRELLSPDPGLGQ